MDEQSGKKGVDTAIINKYFEVEAGYYNLEKSLR
jgi:hypothetical protein